MCDAKEQLGICPCIGYRYLSYYELDVNLS